MRFPVYLRIGAVQVHPHWVFEMLAYAIGFCLYQVLRQRRADALAYDARWWVIAAAAAGALLGSKALHWFEDPWVTFANWRSPVFLFGGNTIVGALIGGLASVEWIKRRLNIRQRTGDLFALPLAVGIAAGRIGCFLTGAEDQTAGVHTSVPWGVNFGDGPRHPTQLYEIIFLIFLGFAIEYAARMPHREGDLFKLFMVGYFGFRLAVDFLKPDLRIIARLSSIQLACAGMLIYYSPDIVRWLLAGTVSEGEPGTAKIKSHPLNPRRIG